jgi:hypothetical protein
LEVKKADGYGSCVGRESEARPFYRVNQRVWGVRLLEAVAEENTFRLFSAFTTTTKIMAILYFTNQNDTTKI